MKTLMIELVNASLEQLPADENVTNLRWLMQIGCYGTLEETFSPDNRVVAAICDQITSAGKRVQVIHTPPNMANDADAPNMLGTSQDAVIQVFRKAQDVLQVGDCDCVLLRTGSMARTAEIESHINSVIGERTGIWHALDTELGTVLGTLDKETAVLVILTAQARTSFILASPNGPLHGNIQGVRLADLARTLLEMDASHVPDDMPGRSLVADTSNNVVDGSGYTEEEEEIVRERLTGLGYIG